MDEKHEALLSVLDELDDYTLVNVWNSHCEKDKRDEDIIHENNSEEINEELSGKTPFECVESIIHYSSTDDYFQNTIYGIETFDNLSEKVDLDELANAIILDSKILTDNSVEEDWAQDLTNAIIEYGFNKGLNTDEWCAPFCNEDLITNDWDELLEDCEADERR